MRKVRETLSFLIPVIALGVLLGFMAGCEGKKMAKLEKNKAIVRRAWEIWNQKNLATADELLAADYLEHVPGASPVQSLEDFKQSHPVFLTGFPDLHVTVEDLIAEGGDKVACRWIWRGTHQGDFMGIPATGVQVTMTAISIFRIADGKVAEVWTNPDLLGMQQQLGVIPPKPSALPALARKGEDFLWGEPSGVTGDPR